MLLGYLLAVGLIIAAVAGADPSRDPSAALGAAVAMGVFELWLAVSVLGIAHRRKITLIDLGFEVPIRWAHVATGVLGAWALVLAYGTFIALLAKVTGWDLGWLGEGNALPDSDARTTEVWIALGIGIVVLAPFCEELFFRGFLFRAFETLRSAGPAMVLSGLAFALVHFNVSVVVPFFTIGVLFAWIYRKSGSIWTPIAAHAIFNGLSFAVTVAGVGS
ncbi:MAG: CPBP family intramembrane metalloprotease [Chloroflexi bacterium]|nr:CPBP family intramembrane metalloprotease [Chloroflexota bacterium]